MISAAHETAPTASWRVASRTGSGRGDLLAQVLDLLVRVGRCRCRRDVGGGDDRGLGAGINYVRTRRSD